MEINPTQQPAVAATRPARRVAPRLLLATLVALPLPLAACSTQTEAPPAPLPMPSVNTTAPASSQPSDQSTQATPVPSGPSQTPLLPEQIQAPVPSDVALENSADGAEAYAYFLFQAWWYLINTHDIDWWDANIPQASWSEPLRSSAIRQIDKGISNRTAPITPTTLDRKVNPENQNEFGITLQASVSEIYAISRDGKTTVAHPAGTYELTARLLYNGNNWDTVAVVLVEAEGEK